MPRSSHEVLVSAMRILARDIQSEDGVANAAILEAADRLDQYYAALVSIRDSKYCDYENTGGGQYGIGVTDGHRYCSNIAKGAINESTNM
jgi:hypothetical protein